MRQLHWHVRPHAACSVYACELALGVWSLGYGGMGFGVWGLGLQVQSLGCGVWGFGFGDLGLGIRVRGFGIQVMVLHLLVPALLEIVVNGL